MPKMTLHELHPAIVHLPLGLFPAAAALDLAAAIGDDAGLDRAGRALWIGGCAAGGLAALSGLAASQEVRADDARARQMLAIHGLGNAAILAAALGLTSWRGSNRATVSSSLIGFTACAASVFTAYLGGEMVYALGMGIKSGLSEVRGSVDKTPLFSAEGPAKLMRDAGAGAAWLVRQAGQIFARKERVREDALHG